MIIPSKVVRLLGAVGLVATVLTVSVGQSAQAIDRPSFCVVGFYRSACAVFVNETQGFAPNSDLASIAHGFKVDYVSTIPGDCASCRNYHYINPILPGETGGANIANISGDVSGAIGTITYGLDRTKFGNKGEITAYVEVPHTGSNSADCRTYQSQFLTCTHPRVAQEGPNKDPWWVWTLVDRPYILAVRNFTDGQLQAVGHPILSEAINSTPGMHSAGSIAAMSGTKPGQGIDTGFLTTNPDKEATLNFEYEVTTGIHAGTVLTIHVKVGPKEVPAPTDQGTTHNVTTGSYCNVSGANTGGLNCEVQRFTPVPNAVNRITVLVN